LQTYEYVPDFSYEEVQDRISCLDSEVPLSYNKVVKSFIDYFTVRDRGYTKLMAQRVNLYFPIFEHYLKEYGLPEELKYLSIIESGLNTTARSRAGAVGLWQFMPSTGRLYKLHQDYYIDERMDPYEATEAACKYLKSLYGMFGDWELALASYNAGPGKVRRAIRRSGYKKSFWEVYNHLPRETRSYVPQFVAIMYVMKHLEDHNLFVDDLLYPIASDTIKVSQYLDLATLGNQLDVCLEDMKKLNPALRRNALPKEAKNYAIRIPVDKMAYFQTNRLAILDSASQVGQQRVELLAKTAPGSTYGKQKISYRVRSGDVLGKIAVRHGVRTSDLRKWNNLRGNLIRVGQRLVIYTNSSAPVAVASAKTKPVTPRDIPNSKVHTVQPGDTLWDISLMYKGLTIDKLKKLNNLSNNKIKPGQKLIIG
jgi:membrane-bound lytic murein transglycosylase D